MMLLTEIIGGCDLTQKILSLHTFIVLPIKAKRTCSQQRKRKMGKVSKSLTQLKVYIVYAVGKKKKEKKKRKNPRRFLLAVPPG